MKASPYQLSADGNHLVDVEGMIVAQYNADLDAFFLLRLTPGARAAMETRQCWGSECERQCVKFDDNGDCVREALVCHAVPIDCPEA